MAPPIHNRLTLTGSLPGGENFQTSCAWANAADFGVPITTYQDALEFLIDDTTNGTWAANLVAWGSSAVPSVVHVTDIALSYIGIGGITQFTAHRSVDYPLGNGSSAAFSVMPDQNALVISLRSNIAGARARGRMYFPALKLMPDADGRLAVADASNMSTRTLTFFRSVAAKLQAQNPNQVTPVIASGESASGPALYPVSYFQVGRVMDTMRSRRSKLTEAPARVDWLPV